MIRVVTIVVMVGWVGVANAGPTRKVTIETVPEGAAVYLNAKEDGPVCEKTPCTFNAPIGETPLIVELAQHREVIQNIVVKKTGRIPTIKLRLEPAVGTLVFEGPKGARITIDDVDRGKAPKQIEVSEEGHHVVVTLNGKTLYDDFVEVVAGDETTVEVKRVASSSDEPDGPDDTPDPRPKLEAKTETKPPRGPYIRVTALFDIGFRTFFYDNIQTGGTIRDLEQEYGQMLGGPLIEAWPLATSGTNTLRGLSLLARFQFGLNAQRVQGITGMVDTAWQSFEIGVRQRFRVADGAALELGAGYTGDKYDYTGATASDVGLIPKVNYQTVRLGVRASANVWRIEPYVSLEGRLVVSGGELPKRFPGASAKGYGAGVGLLAKLGSFQLRGGASAVQYAWSFEYEDMSMLKADGGKDTIYSLQLGVGYAY
ncbi:MAG: PEGA domain-containing protein [Kofleriaceae bacterium]